MSREEAIQVLNMVEAHGSLVIQAKEMAIKALQEPSGDLIRRTDLLDMVEDMTDQFGIKHRVITEGMISLLPSVTPQEPQTEWIPVSERLPELLEDVLMCDNGADIRVGYYRKGHYADGREYFEWHSYENDDYDFEPKAWMPLPEPYKESEDKE